jgi:glycosyltransferase involved in cell wall biosynthesis
VTRPPRHPTHPQRHAILCSPVPDGNAGGVERFCWLLAEILRAHGWHVSIVGPTRQPGRWTFRLGGSPLLWSVSTARAVHAAAVERPPDLIVGNGFLGLGVGNRVLGLGAAGAGGRPLGAGNRPPGGRNRPLGGSLAAVPRIQVFHGTSAAEILAARPSLPRRDFLRRIVSYWPLEATTCRAGRLVVVSDSAARETRRYYRHAADRVIPNGVDTTLFKPRELDADGRRDTAPARARLGLHDDGPMALFVGRPEYRKGADLLLAGCQQAGWQLLHAGARGIPGARHLGVLSPEQLVDAYAAADCLLFPTRYEACSFAILEALACGTPVVTTRIGWMTTLLQAVPEYDALCVQPTVSDITRRLREIAPRPTVAQASRTPSAEQSNHQEILFKSVTRAREYVTEHNSFERFSASWLAAIDEVLAETD